MKKKPRVSLENALASGHPALLAEHGIEPHATDMRVLEAVSAATKPLYDRIEDAYRVIGHLVDKLGGDVVIHDVDRITRVITVVYDFAEGGFRIRTRPQGAGDNE